MVVVSALLFAWPRREVLLLYAEAAGLCGRPLWRSLQLAATVGRFTRRPRVKWARLGPVYHAQQRPATSPERTGGRRSVFSLLLRRLVYGLSRGRRDAHAREHWETMMSSPGNFCILFLLFRLSGRRSDAGFVAPAGREPLSHQRSSPCLLLVLFICGAVPSKPLKRMGERRYAGKEHVVPR